MDEGAEQRRVKFRLLPGKRPQAVLQEEGVAAAGKAVELRGGQGERLSIERLHDGGGHIRKMIAAARREACSLGPDGVREPGRQRGLTQGGAGCGGAVRQKNFVLRAKDLQRGEDRLCSGIEEGGLRGSGDEADTVFRGAERGADPAHLAVDSRLAAGAQVHAEAAELLPLGIGKQTAGVGERGQQPVVRAEDDQHAAAAVAEHGERGELDGVTDGGDGADRGVGDQHGKQLHEQLRLQRCTAEHAVHLLERRDQGLIELAALLRLLGLSGGGERFALRLQAAGDVQLLPEARDGAQARVGVGSLGKGEAQPPQGRDGLFADAVQLFERLCVLRRHGKAEAARVHLPRLFPELTADVPVVDIALEPVAFVFADGRKAGFEEGEHRPLLIAQDRLQGAQEGRDERLFEQRRVRRAVDGDAGAGEKRLHGKRAGGFIGHTDGKIAVAQAGGRSGADLPRGIGTGGLPAAGLDERNILRRTGLCRAAEKQAIQPGLHRRVAGGPGGHATDSGFDALPGSQLLQALFRLVAGLAGSLFTAAGQDADVDGFRVGEDGGEDLLLQGGKVGEAVEEDGAAVQKIRLVQQIAQAHLARDGVAAAGFADGKIALVQQGQLRHLLREPPFKPRSGGVQGVGRDAGGQQLLHERAELAEKIRPGHDGGVEFQLLAYLLGGKIEGQHAAVFVQIFLANAAADGKHPRSQPREAQNLRIAADGIAAAGAERALGLMGILLGDDEDLAGDAGPGVFADLIEDPHGIGRPVRPAEDLQHGRASFGFFLILTCRAGKEKGWKCGVRTDLGVPPPHQSV